MSSCVTHDPATLPAWIHSLGALLLAGVPRAGLWRVHHERQPQPWGSQVRLGDQGEGYRGSSRVDVSNAKGALCQGVAYLRPLGSQGYV